MTERDDLDELLADARLLLDARLDATLPSAELDPQLAEINADARLMLDGLLAQPSVAPRQWRRRSRPAAAAAAALVVLGLAGAAFAASSRWQELQANRAAERDAALAMSTLDREWKAELDRESTGSLSYRLSITPAVVPPAPPPLPSEKPTEIEAPEPSQSIDLAERLASLDAEAYALLRAGEHVQADRRFRTIVRIGGKSEYAELAYGELFALARREGDGDLGELWAAYLQRFPKGRYADAARAGLCRRTPEASQRECWTDYLLEHPHGAARSEALRNTLGD